MDKKVLEQKERQALYHQRLRTDKGIRDGKVWKGLPGQVEADQLHLRFEDPLEIINSIIVNHIANNP